MKKGATVVLLAAVLLTGCGDMTYRSVNPQETAAEQGGITDGFRTVVEQEAGRMNANAASEALQISEEPAAAQKPAAGREQAADQEPETGEEAGKTWEPAAVQEPAAAPPHVCRMDSGSTVTVLAFGEQEPDCFYGATYNVKCRDCGKILDVIYRGPLGHTENEGEVTCWPDCTGGGSIKYTCVRCGAEWNDAYGQMQPHTWVEGIRKETDWLNGGTKEIPYRYCNVCGQREESE